jgi:hypothetical protein
MGIIYVSDHAAFFNTLILSYEYLQDRPLYLGL